MEQAGIQLIDQANTIAIAGHIHPDGDCLGSTLALTLALQKMCKAVYPLKVDSVPDYLHFMPHLDLLVDPADQEVDLFIIVDSSSLDRIGSTRSIFDSAKKTLCIDHHFSNTGLCDVNIVDDTAIATSELVGLLFQKMDLEIDSDMATLLFTGITTDSDRFHYENTSPRTLRLAADLKEAGARWKDIYFHLYENQPLNKLKMHAEVLAQTEFLREGALNYAVVTEAQAASYGLTLADTDEVVSMLRDIRGVRVSVLVKAHERGHNRVSFRSKGNDDVAQIAIALGGGGHVHAAGATVDGDLQEVRKIIMDQLENFPW